MKNIEQKSVKSVKELVKEILEAAGGVNNLSRRQERKFKDYVNKINKLTRGNLEDFNKFMLPKIYYSFKDGSFSMPEELKEDSFNALEKDFNKKNELITNHFREKKSSHGNRLSIEDRKVFKKYLEELKVIYKDILLVESDFAKLEKINYSMFKLYEIEEDNLDDALDRVVPFFNEELRRVLFYFEENEKIAEPKIMKKMRKKMTYSDFWEEHLFTWKELVNKKEFSLEKKLEIMENFLQEYPKGDSSDLHILLSRGW